jgi:hypothetical protein
MSLQTPNGCLPPDKEVSLASPQYMIDLLTSLPTHRIGIGASQSPVDPERELEVVYLTVLLHPVHLALPHLRHNSAPPHQRRRDQPRTIVLKRLQPRHRNNVVQYHRSRHVEVGLPHDLDLRLLHPLDPIPMRTHRLLEQRLPPLQCLLGGISKLLFHNLHPKHPFLR